MALQPVLQVVEIATATIKVVEEVVMALDMAVVVMEAIKVVIPVALVVVIKVVINLEAMVEVVEVVKILIVVVAAEEEVAVIEVEQANSTHLGTFLLFLFV